MEQKNNADDIASAWAILIIGIPTLLLVMYIGHLNLQSYFKGKVVNAVVSGTDCGFRNNWLYLTYQDQEYSLCVGREKCRNSVIGEVIPVRLLVGNYIVYFPDENPFVLIVIICACFTLSIVYALRTLYKSRH